MGVAGIAMLLTLFLPALLSGSVAPQVASIIMADTPWRSGRSPMAFSDPADWDRLVAACHEAAAKTGKAQRCTITVEAPE